ncbi:MAG: DEAD/DEAH box helicase [Limnochordia bacterium]
MVEQELATYRGYTLDAFQREAIEALAAGDSVLVSAPTGTGKTLIADYLIEMTFRAGRQVVYTAPIKALSNQKFKEFKALLGEENVGILTGDIVVNPTATVLIMTTEIFRNLLHTEPARLENVSHVIFDEIHYIDDPERGSVWEESLIFMPPTMRFLGLSATVPNIHELARWIEEIHGRPVRVVIHRTRAVPLEHHLFEQALGECTFKQLEKRYRRYAARFGTTPSGSVAATFEPTRHIDLVRHIAPDLLPCLFFTFSRRKCEQNARELAETQAWLSAEEQEQVMEVIERTLRRYEGAGERSLREIQPILLRGVAYHHAGLLPVVKDVVEELFERRLIQVLYCTETFAVGLNFPCRTVCFDSLSKWDGSRFRSLTNREYFQMAGRAGRRGIDEKGYVFAAVDFNFFNPRDFPSLREEDVEPIESRFTLSYNTVLNLVKNYQRDEIESILRRNFATFQLSQTKQRLHRELEKLRSERDRLLGDLSWRDADRLLEAVESQRALARLERALERKQAAGERKGQKALRREIREHRRVVQRVRSRFGPEALERFQRLAKEYRALESRIEGIETSLAELPADDAFIQEFEEKLALLAALDYVRDGQLTSRGLFASEINGSELLVTELFFRGVFHDWSEDEINALAASLDYDPRKGEERRRHRVFDTGLVKRTVEFLAKMERVYLGFSQTDFNDHLAEAAYLWSRGEPFGEVVRVSGADEGDVVFAFRRAIDVLRQVRQAARQDEILAAKLSRCIQRMDRDEVSILL